MRSGPNSVSKPFAHRVAAAITANVLAHEKDAVVAMHCIADRFAHRIAIGQFDRSGLGCLVPWWIANYAVLSA